LWIFFVTILKYNLSLCPISKKRQMSSGIRDLTRGSIFGQMANLAFPIMATSFIQMAYSLTDMAWVGRLGSEAAAAVGAVGMLLWLTQSIALLSKVSAEVTVGQSIGAGRFDEAAAYASHTATIAVIISLITACVCFFGADAIVSFFNLNSRISTEAVRYLHIVSTAIPFTFMILTFAGIYNASGNSRLPFYLISTGLILNMILDPLFIYGIGSIKGRGVTGAAIATWLAQGVVLLLFIWQMKKPGGILNRFPYLIRLRKKHTLRIFRIGLPVTLMNVLFASINSYLARIASAYGGHIGVTSQTTGGQIEGITWYTSLGFSTALGAFTAQNYGAGKIDRMRKAYRYTLLFMISIGCLMTAGFVLAGKQIFGLFIPEKEAMIAGGEYLAIMGVSQIFMTIEITTQGMFNGIGKTIHPSVISIFFNLLRIPLAIYLASVMGITGVWWAISISSIIKGIILPVWFRFISKKSLPK
jgi:putative MATE family efflux protein